MSNQSVFDIVISFESVFGVDNTSDYDNIITLVCFLRYKEWFMLSLENKSRRNIITIWYFRDETFVFNKLAKMFAMVPLKKNQFSKHTQKK